MMLKRSPADPPPVALRRAAAFTGRFAPDAERGFLRAHPIDTGSKSNRLGGGGIAGITIAVVVVVGILAVLAYFYFRRRRARREAAPIRRIRGQAEPDQAAEQVQQRRNVKRAGREEEVEDNGGMGIKRVRSAQYARPVISVGRFAPDAERGFLRAHPIDTGSKSNRLGGGGIAGITIAVVVVVWILAMLSYFYFRRRRARREAAPIWRIRGQAEPDQAAEQVQQRRNVKRARREEEAEDNGEMGIKRVRSAQYARLVISVGQSSELKKFYNSFTCLYGHEPCRTYFSDWLLLL
ncbi:hypothetical protein ACQ4PT_017024 [Festuca glaucescens]